MRGHTFLLGALAFMGIASCQTVSPQQQHSDDQSKCAGYGYQPGTNAFAKCMMTLDDRRQDQVAHQQRDDDRMKALSIQRNGDTRFPVCSAAMMDTNLDTTNNAWYGPNCREK